MEPSTRPGMSEKAPPPSLPHTFSKKANRSANSPSNGSASARPVILPWDSKETRMDDTTTIQFDLAPPSDVQRHELETDLTEQERHVLLEHGTEAPFCGVFLDEKREGLFTCRLCGLPLFKGGSEFESGSGSAGLTEPCHAR